MTKKLTITVDDEIYLGLHSVIGARRISRFLTVIKSMSRWALLVPGVTRLRARARPRLFPPRRRA